jgi:glutamyl-tRNA reductase
MYILLVGLNHKSAPVEVREQLAFNSQAAAIALEKLKRKYPGGEFVLLSTCNRVELYVAMEKSSDVLPSELAAFVAEMRGVDFNELRKYLYVMRDQHVVRHLLTVTSSLDSMVIGENQISSQVRESYGLACDVKSSAKVLNHLFHAAFAVSKKVFTNTSIASRRTSVAGVAVDLAKQLFDDIKTAKVVVIGAGEMGELLVEHFLHIKCTDITVVNRTQHRGCSLAVRHGVKAAKWDELESRLLDADIVVGAASPDSGYLFDKKDFAKVISKRRGKTLLAVDITVPRSFDPKINKLEGVYLYCIDDLSQVIEKNVKLREGDLEKAVEIICQGVGGYMEWFARRDLGPLIGRMKVAFENIQKGEMEKFFAGDREHACCKDEMDTMVSRIVNKLLHCVIQDIETVASQQGPDDALRLAESILAHAESVADGERSK